MVLVYSGSSSFDPDLEEFASRPRPIVSRIGNLVVCHGLKLMEPFDSFLIWIADFLGDHLYEGIFLAALLETIIPPIPTLAIFPTAGFLASQQGVTILGIIPMIILGSIGATIGSTAIYLIALKLGRIVLLRYLKYVKVNEKKLERVESLV